MPETAACEWNRPRSPAAAGVGLQGAPRDVDSCYNGLPDKAQCQNKQRPQLRVKGPRRQQSEASPCRRNSGSYANGKSGQVGTVKNEPCAQENQPSNDSR